MINAKLKPRDTEKIRDSLHKLRDVELSRNKGNKTNVKMCRGRKPSEIEKAVKDKKRKTKEKEDTRKTIPELGEEESVRRACEAIKNAIIKDKLPASPQMVKQATIELAKATIRCR